MIDPETHETITRGCPNCGHPLTKPQLGHNWVTLARELYEVEVVVLLKLPFRLPVWEDLSEREKVFYRVRAELLWRRNTIVPREQELEPGWLQLTGE
jgi:hypothetical protein